MEAITSRALLLAGVGRAVKHAGLVVFNSLGRVLSALRSREGRSIEAMAHGPDGLYLVDRLSRQVVVIRVD